tara:strand:- start:38 stop:148 length:111 start_codon:yes stop_codon:yes gene_type:complete
MSGNSIAGKKGMTNKNNSGKNIALIRISLQKEAGSI